MAVPDATPDLPLWQQIAFNFGAFVAVAMAAFVGYFRREGTRPSIEAQVVGGALADRQSMERLAETINGLALRMGATTEYLEEIAKSLRRITEEAERVGRTQDRVAAAIEAQARLAATTVVETPRRTDG